MTELATSDEGRTVMGVLAGTAEIGRSILTTPGVPPERLAALRTASRPCSRIRISLPRRKAQADDRPRDRRADGRRHPRNDEAAEGHHRSAAARHAELRAD